MTIEHRVSHALAAHEDEWTYITELGATWRERIEELIGERGNEPVTPPRQAAIDRANR